MLGGIFPLIARAMFTRMTFAGAASFLGGIVSMFPVLLATYTVKAYVGYRVHFLPSYHGYWSFTGLEFERGVSLQVYVWEFNKALPSTDLYVEGNHRRKSIRHLQTKTQKALPCLCLRSL